MENIANGQQEHWARVNHINFNFNSKYFRTFGMAHSFFYASAGGSLPTRSHRFSTPKMRASASKGWSLWKGTSGWSTSTGIPSSRCSSIFSCGGAFLTLFSASSFTQTHSVQLGGFHRVVVKVSHLLTTGNPSPSSKTKLWRTTQAAMVLTAYSMLTDVKQMSLLHFIFKRPKACSMTTLELESRWLKFNCSCVKLPSLRKGVIT